MDCFWGCSRPFLLSRLHPLGLLRTEVARLSSDCARRSIAPGYVFVGTPDALVGLRQPFICDRAQFLEKAVELTTAGPVVVGAIPDPIGSAEDVVVGGVSSHDVYGKG